MFSHMDLSARCSPSVETVIEDFLKTTSWGSPVNAAPPATLSVKMDTKIWHPDTEFLSEMLTVGVDTWETWAFMDRLLALVLLVFARIQLHDDSPPVDVRKPAEVEFVAVFRHLSRVVVGTLPATTLASRGSLNYSCSRKARRRQLLSCPCYPKCSQVVSLWRTCSFEEDRQSANRQDNRAGPSSSISPCPPRRKEAQHPRP